MIAGTRCSWTAIVVLILTSLSAAGDSQGVVIDSGRPAVRLALQKLPGHDPGRPETRRPYERGKVPVVFVHGLWGSPRNWDRMIADLEADPALRTRFQFWTVRYASGDSIPYSAHLLRQSLRRAREAFDPDGTDTTFNRMILVGHSLGGILAKRMVQSGGPRLWQTICERPIEQILGPPEEVELLRQAFFYKPVPEVRRVIFIATPHRGSPLATGTLGGLGTQLCWRPNRFRQGYDALFSRNQPDMFAPGLRGGPGTSVGELAPGHPFLLGLCDLGIDPSVRSHSVIADLRAPERPSGTDGIVPYSSSHLDGVVSESLVHGSHHCVNDPAVIEEIGRILNEYSGGQTVLSDQRRTVIPPSKRDAIEP
jgi:triacylglycerol esterase/lipase EstA (alpha/beta hydrolase family)